MRTRKRRIRTKDPILGQDNIGPIFGYNSRNEPICNSKAKHGGRCGSTKRCSPSGRCRYHGGTSTGPAPVSGLWHRNLPSHLLRSYEESLTNPDFGSMKESIAVTDALIAQYLNGLMKTPPVETLQLVTAQTYEAVNLLQDIPEYPIELEEFIISWREKLTNIVSTRSEEREVRQALRERAELVKAEAQRVDKASRYITVEQAMTLVAALITVVNKHVEDESVRIRVARAINNIVNPATREGPGSEDEPISAEIVSSTS